MKEAVSRCGQSVDSKKKNKQTNFLFHSGCEWILFYFILLFGRGGHQDSSSAPHACQAGVAPLS